MRRCLFCYGELGEGDGDYHRRCARRFFGDGAPPVLPYVRGDIDELARQVVRSQTTLTGVQTKLSLDIANDADGRPAHLAIVGLWGRYILKPPTPLYPHLPELEDLTMHLARLARVSVVPHSLIRFADGELCYITRRIDRTPTGRKLAMEDMCQLTERLTEQKYKGSYEQIAKAIRRFSAIPLLDVANFWELVVFSWIVGNADMHLKNFSLYSPRPAEFVLAPAYDLLATAIVMPDDTEELALTLNAKKRKIRKEDFVAAMRTSGVGDNVAQKLFGKFAGAYRRWCQFVDVSFLPAHMRREVKEFVAERLKRLQ